MGLFKSKSFPVSHVVRRSGSVGFKKCKNKALGDPYSMSIGELCNLYRDDPPLKWKDSHKRVSLSHCFSESDPPILSLRGKG